ncbi:MAG: arylsulfatase [Candidatus Melainabacteria bacterium]|nr:arylsulfatase [Candidatus Melainabacteria bacterium]
MMTLLSLQSGLCADSKKPPNILVIMGDDIGIWNIGAYHRGMMSGKTPNLDKLASQGAILTDYYAEASCTAGRANFITGELPIRTGLTTVGQAGADVGMPDQACTLATVLKSRGYATGQFGKNHLGDLNKYLPTLHGFDEFHGYLYHLDAMSDPYWHSYPSDPNFRAKYGPRNVLHTWATDTDDTTEMPRWGKVGKQKIQDDGPLPPHHVDGAQYDMTTFDSVLLGDSTGFMDKAKKDGKPFFVWHNTTRMHIYTFLSEKYKAMQNSTTNYGIEEAGMAELDDCVGGLIKHLEDIGEADNTIVIFTTDNGTETFTWPDGGNTPFKGQKGTVYEGGFRVPCIVRWPGKVQPGSVQNGIFSGLDWFPTLANAAGATTVKSDLAKGAKFGERTYKNHLDGYDQTQLLAGTGPSNRHEIFYFAGPHLGAVRFDDFKFRFFEQPQGWVGRKDVLDVPTIINLRQDPFERFSTLSGESTLTGGMGYFNDFLAREFWRFVMVQDQVAKLGSTAVEYPPMQDPASFNLAEVKKKIDAMIKAHEGR